MLNFTNFVDGPPAHPGRNKAMKSDKKSLYSSPEVNTIEIRTQAIVCQSGGDITNMIVDPDGRGDFE